MIYGIGIDSVEIKRLAHWRYYKKSTLLKIFLPAELDYCLSNPLKSAERFAVRFAAKEAFLKAFYFICDVQKPSLITICKNIEITKNLEMPGLIIFGTLQQYTTIALSLVKAHISLTHTKNIATALVILESQGPRSSF